MAVKSKLKLDPLKIFQHASSFHISYDKLSKSVPHDEENIGLIIHPAMTLSAFASELYLKCLLCVETGDVPNGHNLKKLFDGLDLMTRRELDDIWDSDIRRPEKRKVLDQLYDARVGKPLRLDLRYALDVGANSFIELRYFYEKERAFFLLADFPYILRKVILNRLPSWGTVLPKPSKGLLY